MMPTCQWPRASQPLTRSAWRSAGLAALLPVLISCSVVPDAERLLSLLPDGTVSATSQPCGAATRPAVASTGALDPNKLRVVSWNIHKGVDTGWEPELARQAADHDLVLVQEAVLSKPMRSVLERAGHSWQMTGAFTRDGEERGVLNAARVAPLDTCTTREFEPLFRLPKTAIVTRYAFAGSTQTVAVANLHGINFTLGLGSFRSQLQAVADELARHKGPIIWAGDFNTWSDDRSAVLNSVTESLGLTAVHITPDGRRRTLGKHLDHLFVRGFKVVGAAAHKVKSSDHNPIEATLAVLP